MRLCVLPPPKPVLVWITGAPPLPEKTPHDINQQVADARRNIGPTEEHRGVAIHGRRAACLYLLQVSGKLRLLKTTTLNIVVGTNDISPRLIAHAVVVGGLRVRPCGYFFDGNCNRLNRLGIHSQFVAKFHHFFAQIGAIDTSH